MGEQFNYLVVKPYPTTTRMMMEQIHRAGAMVVQTGSVKIFVHNIYKNLICSLSDRFIQIYAAKSYIFNMLS